MINWLMITYLPSLVLYELFYFCGVYAVVVGWMVSFVFLYMVLCVVNWRCLRLYISQPVMLVLCLSVKVMANSHGWRSTLPFLCGATFTLCRPSLTHSLTLSASISSFWATFALCRPNPHSLCVFLPSEPHSLCADPTLSLSLSSFWATFALCRPNPLSLCISSFWATFTLCRPNPLSLSLSLSLCFFLLNQPSLTLSHSVSVSVCISSFWATFALCRPNPLSLSLTLSVCLSVSLSLCFFLLKLCLYCWFYSIALVSCHFITPPPPFPRQGHNHWWGTYPLLAETTLHCAPPNFISLSSLTPLKLGWLRCGPSKATPTLLGLPSSLQKPHWDCTGPILSLATLWHIPPWLGSTLPSEATPKLGWLWCLPSKATPYCRACPVSFWYQARLCWTHPRPLPTDTSPTMSILPSSPPRPLPYCWAHLQGHTHTVGPAPFPSKTRLDCWTHPCPLPTDTSTARLTIPTSPPRPLPYCWAHLQYRWAIISPSSTMPRLCWTHPLSVCLSVCLSVYLSVCLSVCLSFCPSLCALWHDLRWVGLALTPPHPSSPILLGPPPMPHTHTVGPSPPLPPLPPPPPPPPRLDCAGPIQSLCLLSDASRTGLASPSPHPHPHCWSCPLSFETTPTLCWTQPLSLSSDTPHASLALLLLFPGHTHTVAWTPPPPLSLSLSLPPTPQPLTPPTLGWAGCPLPLPSKATSVLLGPSSPLQGHTHIVEPALSLKPGLHSSAPPPPLLPPPFQSTPSALRLDRFIHSCQSFPNSYTCSDLIHFS